MVVSISQEQFVRQLSDSGLLSPDLLQQSLTSIAAHPEILDGPDLARHMVETGRLTAFQADAVLERRYNDLHVGNYDVLERVGAGGMGAVFKARHRRMKRIVALKFLRRETAGRGTFAERFQREVETIAQLSHPNIVMAYDADETEDGPFLVMEYVDGRDLASEVSSGGPLSVAEAVAAIGDAAKGLAYAHSRGFVHRDVKPANLLRTTGGRTKVADLGLARIQSDGEADGNGITQAGAILGTVDYMAPEQAIDLGGVDHRADIYSLGCTLYFVLTGSAPFFGGSMMGTLLRHREAPIPSIRAVRPDVPTALDSLFARMVAKNPAARPESMAAVVSALDALESECAPLSQRPAQLQERSLTAVRSLEATVALDQDRPTSVDEHAPNAAHDAPAETTPVTAIPLAGELSVVLVEPSRAQARIVQSYLRQLGIGRVVTVDTGRDAMTTVKAEHINIVLCAMHLADMTGVQLAEALFADSAAEDVGFVLGSSDPACPLSAPRSADRASLVLRKPFDLRTLAHALARAVGRAVDESLLPASENP